MTECCPCPDKKKEQCKDQGEVVCEKKLEPKPKTLESCAKDTCPSYQSRCTKGELGFGSLEKGLYYEKNRRLLSNLSL